MAYNFRRHPLSSYGMSTQLIENDAANSISRKHTRTHARRHTHKHPHTHTHTHTVSLSLSLSLTHTHTHTHTLQSRSSVHDQYVWRAFATMLKVSFNFSQNWTRTKKDIGTCSDILLCCLIPSCVPWLVHAQRASLQTAREAQHLRTLFCYLSCPNGTWLVHTERYTMAEGEAEAIQRPRTKSAAAHRMCLL